MTPAERKPAIELIHRAYAALDPLNDIELTSHRDRCFDLALAEERRHRSPIPYTGPRPSWGLTLATAARLFVVKRIAEAMLAPDKTTIRDVIHFQPSAIYAASIAANWPDVIRKAWGGIEPNLSMRHASALPAWQELAQRIAALDYAALVQS